MHSFNVRPDDLRSGGSSLQARTSALTVAYLDFSPTRYMGWGAGGADEAVEPAAGRNVNKLLTECSVFADAMGKDLKSTANHYDNTEDDNVTETRRVHRHLEEY